MYARNSRPGARKCVLLFPCFVFIALLLATLFVHVHTAEAASPHVDVMVLNYDIGPVSLRTLTRAIDTAEHDGSQALVLEIDTPGGDIESMKSMTQAELASTVPIISYVSPAGGRAASAGAFVALAAPIAAMAPTTRIGASSPVDATGADIGSTLKAKIENDLVASMTGIQSRYGRNVALATAMVTQAKSYDDVTAVQQHIVDLGGNNATNLATLLNTVNGQAVKLGSGRTVTLQTSGANAQTVGATLGDQVYGLLLDPNIAFLLFVIALIGIYVEISHPGAILPGVAGSIALLLFLFAAGSLAPNWAGLALMLLALVLLVLDVRLPTHGALTIGAVISLIVGALLFFNGGSPEGPKVNPLIVYIMGAFIGVVGFTLVTFAIRARRARVNTGVEGMIGARVTSITPLTPDGRVSYGGENWAAILDDPKGEVGSGTKLVITAVQGLRLHVRPLPMRPELTESHDALLK